MIARRKTSAQRCLEMTGANARGWLAALHDPGPGVGQRRPETAASIPPPMRQLCGRSDRLMDSADRLGVSSTPNRPTKNELVTLQYRRGTALGFKLSPNDGRTCVENTCSPSREGRCDIPCVGWTLVQVAGERVRWGTAELVQSQIELAPPGAVALTWRTNGIKPTVAPQEPVSPQQFQATRLLLRQTLRLELRTLNPASPEQFDAAVEQLRQPPAELHHGANDVELSVKTRGPLSAVLPRSPRALSNQE